MALTDLIRARLAGQQLTSSGLTREEELISWLGAIQGQDYTSSKWAIGIRLPGITDEKVEQAVRSYKIIRTWIMRGTLHLAAASDIRWMLSLLAPRLIRSGMPRNRQLELDEDTFRKSNNMLFRVLEGRKHLTREELKEMYEREGISTTGQRFIHLVQRAALEQIVCFGPRRQKQFTFMALHEAVPPSQTAKTKEEALAELTMRYFQSRGPATLSDFIWWSGLTTGEAREGMEAVKAGLQHERIDGQAYFFANHVPVAPITGHSTWLLPAFDEFVIAYRDRNAMLGKHQTKQVISSNGIFYPVIVVNGIITGIWKRNLQKEKLVIDIHPFTPFSKDVKEEITIAAEAFARFTGKKAEPIRYT